MVFSKMDYRVNSPTSELNTLEIAKKILQIYVESLQDHNTLRNILSKCAILDYFGKYFYGRDEICKHLMSNLHGSSFELTSLITNDEEACNEDNYLCDLKVQKSEEELGVSLMSIPSSSFPGLSLVTPIETSFCKNFLKKSFGKRNQQNSYISSLPGKKCKLHSARCENIYIGGLLRENKNLELSPETFEKNNMKYVSSFGTIYFAKQALSTVDPKRIKHHNIGTPKQRFCHLHINFKCDEPFKNISDCKIWKIRYTMRSKMTPRNLMKSFAENEHCQSEDVSEK